jgi:hypothetical protein
MTMTVQRSGGGDRSRRTRRGTALLILATALVVATMASGFVVSPTIFHHSTSVSILQSSSRADHGIRWKQKLHAGSDWMNGKNDGVDNSNSNFPPPSPSSSSPGGNHWELYNSFELFLNQCSIQSVLFLMNSLRDRHTALWLEDFTQPLIHVRTKDVNNKREQVLSNMATAFNDAMTMSQQVERPIRLLTYHGLNAINTTIYPTWMSYFERLLEQSVVTYTIESNRLTYDLDINPASLCSRIISVREQIAREFVNDLDVIAESSLQAMENYYKKATTPTTGPVGLDRINQYFLEMSIHEDYVPSPLRKGNFDLLQTLTTQEAIHRILNRSLPSTKPSSGQEEECPTNDDKSGSGTTIDYSSLQFLRNFYVKRIGTHFTGSNFYARADDFLDELLWTPPSIVQLQDSDCGLVDPIGIVDLILKEREQVASEWIEIALDVPQAHTEIKRLQLNILMGAYNNNPPLTENNNNSSFE